MSSPAKTEVPTPTPGPWIAREQFSKDGKSLGWIIEHANGRIGWSSYATAEPNEGEGPPYTISAANAKLLASAPDLVKALEFIRDGYANQDVSHVDYRVKVYQVALEALSNSTVAREELKVGS